MKNVIDFTVIALVFFLTLFGLSVIASPANAQAAQQTCGPYVKMAAGLKSKYNERPVSRGLHNSGKMIMEIWTAENGSFSVVMKGADGWACMVAAGSNYQAVAPEHDGLEL